MIFGTFIWLHRGREGRWDGRGRLEPRPPSMNNEGREEELIPLAPMSRDRRQFSVALPLTFCS